MHVKAHLDVDMVAVETTDKISLMVDLTAPIGDAQKTRPGQAVQDPRRSAETEEGEVVFLPPRPVTGAGL